MAGKALSHSQNEIKLKNTRLVQKLPKFILVQISEIHALSTWKCTPPPCSNARPRKAGWLPKAQTHRGHRVLETAQALGGPRRGVCTARGHLNLSTAHPLGDPVKTISVPDLS